jgi:uncharacterized protein (DUF302 family)
MEEAKARVIDELKKEGFGVLTEINVKETLKQKINVDFRDYLILGACNPPFAYKAITAEEKIGLMLPCNIIIHKKGDQVEIAAIDPVASMKAVNNPELAKIAEDVRFKLQQVILRVSDT